MSAASSFPACACGNAARYVDESGALTCALCPVRAGVDSVRVTEVPALLEWARLFLIWQATDRPADAGDLADLAGALRLIVGRGPREMSGVVERRRARLAELAGAAAREVAARRGLPRLFSPGDRVTVTAGRCAGMTGHVLHYSFGAAVVRPDGDGEPTNIFVIDDHLTAASLPEDDQ